MAPGCPSVAMLGAVDGERPARRIHWRSNCKAAMFFLAGHPFLSGSGDVYTGRVPAPTMAGFTQGEQGECAILPPLVPVFEIMGWFINIPRGDQSGLFVGLGFCVCVRHCELVG